MSKNQNVVVFMEPSGDAYNICTKGANMCLNRFCIGEDAAFELSGVYNFVKCSEKVTYKTRMSGYDPEAGKG